MQQLGNSSGVTQTDPKKINMKPVNMKWFLALYMESPTYATQRQKRDVREPLLHAIESKNYYLLNIEIYILQATTDKHLVEVDHSYLLERYQEYFCVSYFGTEHCTDTHGILTMHAKLQEKMN